MATREEVLAAYANNPYASLVPDESAINYWANAGLSGFDDAVQAVRQSNPELARQIDAQKTVANAYEQIGRTGVGTAPSNIDQQGLDYWTNQLTSGAIAPNEFGNVFGGAVVNYLQTKPNDPVTQYVMDYLTPEPVTQSQIPITSTSPITSVNPVDARASQGALNPSDALQRLLSGNVQNPYLDQQAAAITSGLTRNFAEQVLPQIRSQYLGSGQYGSSRQGIAEGLAASRLQQDIAAPLANLYGGAFENAQQRMYGTANTLNQQAVDLANANANRDLQQYGMNQGFYTQQRGQDLSQLQIGANLYGLGIQGGLSQGQGLYGVGSTYQQAPWQTMGYLSQAMQPFTGLGSSTTSQPGNFAAGALGGGIGGYQLAKLF